MKLRLRELGGPAAVGRADRTGLPRRAGRVRGGVEARSDSLRESPPRYDSAGRLSLAERVTYATARMRPFDLNGLKTYDLASRPCKVFVDDLGRPVDPATPDRRLARLAAPAARRATTCAGSATTSCRAHRDGRTVAAALGGHVIKTGCAPYLIDWIQRGVDQGRGHERLGGDPRLRAGPRRQDQRGRRRRSLHGRPVRHGPRDGRRLRRRRPRRRRERARPRPRARAATSTSSAARTPTRAWCWPPTGPASPARSTSRSAPTSSTCTRTSPGRRSARRRCIDFRRLCRVVATTAAAASG